MGKPLHALLVEDSEDDALLLVRELRRGGFDPVDERVDNARAMRAALDERTWDVILGDYNMPKFSAPAALKLVEEAGLDLPFIVVSGVIGEEHAAGLMKAGAHDLILKHNLARLVPAVERAMAEAEVRRERRRAEQAVRDSEERLRSIASNVPGAIFQCVLTPDGTLQYPFLTGGTYRELYGRDPDEIMADPSILREIIHPDDYGRWLEDLQESAHSLETQDTELRIVAPSGEIKWVRSVASPRRLENGDVVWDGLLLDVTDRKEADKRIQHLAYFDQLTGLPNRALFVDRLTSTIAAAERTGRVLTVLSINLDRFQVVNDTLGHAAGDEILKTVAERLAGAVREVDTVARVGADQFVALLPVIRKAEDAALVVRKLFVILKPVIVINGHKLHLTASIGVSLYPMDGTDAETLLKNADAALHKAKERGGACHQFFTNEMHVALSERFTMERELPKALKQGQLVLHYQPVVDATTGNIVEAEALVRWQHPDKGLLSPAKFIPLAEETGLVVPLGDWVLRAACLQTKAWQEKGLAPISIAVNLSARQLSDPGFPAAVKRVLDKTGLDPSRLKLELTESMIMEDEERVAGLLRALYEAGISFSIDDFGTGYSSLGRLPRFPIKTLKIDWTFVRDMTSNPRHATVINAIIAMAHSLDLETVAEGVETEEQLTFLRAYTCDKFQGYLMSPPLPPDKFAQLLAEKTTLGDRTFDMRQGTSRPPLHRRRADDGRGKGGRPNEGRRSALKARARDKGVK